MRYTQSFIVTRRDAPADAELVSHQLMVRAAMIRKIAGGIYAQLPLGIRVLEKVSTIIREELNAAGCEEVLMPAVLPRELMEETGRWDQYGKEMFRLTDRHERAFYLGPTHEEVICELVRKELKSYKQLPLNLFQIQNKFRDEIRPRFGVMRGRSFLMKDAYSFDVDEAASHLIYQKMFETYQKIFTRCGLRFRAVEALTGMIGGSLSHEFQVLADSGEDEIFSCTQCEYAANREKIENPDRDPRCPQCQGTLAASRGIEVGHIFYLGTKYSGPMQVNFLDQAGKAQAAVMGCYGIGVDRTVAAAIEQNHDEHGIIWPQALSPYDLTLLSLGMDNTEVARSSEKIYQALREKGLDLLWDDRYESAGVKFADADLIGIPLQVVVGQRGLKEGTLELKQRFSSEKRSIPIDQILPIVMKEVLHA